jgi:hypothetical protein
MNISIDTSLVSDEAEPLLAAIRELAPAINARVAEIEAGRRLPLDLVPRQAEQPRRPRAVGASMDDGRSPAVASMPTGWPGSAS